MDMRSEPSIAIIILNWNSYEDTYECLKSLEQLCYTNFHVFLVDNFSEDDSFLKLDGDIMKGVFEINVTLIQSGGNLGFAGGNNVGIRLACKQKFEYIWLLNNDTVADTYALTALIKVAKKEPKTGIFGSKIYYYGTDIIWFAGGIVNNWTGKTKHIGLKEKDLGQHDQIKYVDYITGCSLLFRIKLLDIVGYMQDDYFLYYEETEWNIRARQKGWDIMYVPLSKINHKVSMTTGGEDNPAPFVAYYDIRNGLSMIKRTQGKFKICTAFLFALWKVVKKHIKLIVKRQNNKVSRSYLIIKGLTDGLRTKMGKL